MNQHLIILAQSTENSGGNPLAQVLMAAGVMMLIVLAVINGRKRLRQRRQQPSLTPHEKVERIKQTHGMKNDLRDMMVELEDLTRRFSAQLDAKAVRLERLIDEADQRIARLENGEAGGGRGGERRSSKVAAAAGEASPPPTEEEEPAEATDPLTQSVYELADAGHEPIAIARQLDEHVGKVELILALREP